LVRWLLVVLCLSSVAEAQLVVREEVQLLIREDNRIDRKIEKLEVQQQKIEAKQQNLARKLQPDYVVAFTASYCGPCRQWKSSSVPAELEAAGYDVVYVDVDQSPEWRDRIAVNGKYSVPTFWIADRATRTKKRQIRGAITIDDVRRVTVVPAQPPPVMQSSGIYNGRSGNSHQNRQTLIQHLANDGIHRGKHSISSLNAMSDQQLDQLHSQDHNN
jgi:hypothetical protein